MELPITNEAFGRAVMDTIRSEYERQNSISLEKSPWDVRNSITLADYHAIPAHIAADALAKGGRK